jgi:hypothetical protein
LRFNLLIVTVALTACGSSKSAQPPGADPVPAPSADRPATAEPDTEPATNEVSTTDLEAHIAALKKTVPEGFSVVAQAPFAVIGDEPLATVQRRAEGTVKWAVDHLKRAYFTKDPVRILDVWLFKDETSYNHYTREIFDDDPGTPYGYYSSHHGALIMNIATGGGTLVHEIVHPFIESNFPECPSWFNEGLGSLYEQSSERDGHIIGLTNWRLPGLQEAIGDGTVPRFGDLMSTTEIEFYDEDPGTNYSQSRYLLYYLQEQGLLHDYYRKFHANVGDDPTGYETLKDVLGRRDIDTFQKEWESWVLTLRR